MTFSIEENGGKKKVVIFTVGPHAIESVMFWANKEEMLRLRDLVNATLKKLE